MKKISSLLLACCITIFASGQEIDSVTLSKLRLNFTVPDMPAFKTLQTEPSNLLKPSTPMAFAVTMSQLYQDRKFVLPKAFAVEISPSLLLNANKGPVQLKQYAKRAVANSFRISLGTSTDTLLKSQARNMGIGLRVSLINKGDLGTDTVAHQQISKLLEKFRKNVRSVSMLKFAELHQIDTKVVDWDVALTVSPLKEEFAAYLANEEESSQKIFLTDLQKLKDQYKKDHWNATKLDLALSMLGTSSDSLFKNLQFNRAELWITWAQKAGPKGQFMLGLNAQSVKDIADTAKASKASSYSNISIPARFLLGTNRVKGFAEAQYSYRGQFKESSFIFSLGADFNITDGIWLNLSGGFDNNSSLNISKFIANFNLKLTLPEKYKLF